MTCSVMAGEGIAGGLGISRELSPGTLRALQNVNQQLLPSYIIEKNRLLVFKEIIELKDK